VRVCKHPFDTSKTYHHGCTDNFQKHGKKSVAIMLRPDTVFKARENQNTANWLCPNTVFKTQQICPYKDMKLIPTERSRNFLYTPSGRQLAPMQTQQPISASPQQPAAAAVMQPDGQLECACFDHSLLTRKKQQQAALGPNGADYKEGSWQVQWNKSLDNCSGLFNIGHRANEIQRYRSNPAQAVPVRIVVEDSLAEACNCNASHSFFVCFRFSSTEPFVAPGTPVHFYNRSCIQACDARHLLIDPPQPSRSSVIASVCVAA
jgi:hypothetical protein